MRGTRPHSFVHNSGFETTRIRELSERFPRLARQLVALNERVVDLLPVAREHYYHPSQQGSWSIKAVLPALCPDLNYGSLDGVQKWQYGHGCIPGGPGTEYKQGAQS